MNIIDPGSLGGVFNKDQRPANFAGYFAWIVPPTLIINKNLHQMQRVTCKIFLQKLYFIQPSLCSLVSVSTIAVINWETHFRGPNFKNLSGGAHSCTTPPQQSCLWVELYLCRLVLKFCLPIQFLLKTLTEVMVYQRNWCINTQSGFICS